MICLYQDPAARPCRWRNWAASERNPGRPDPSYHKDLRPLEYVVGDAVGRLGAPIYPMMEIDERP